MEMKLYRKFIRPMHGYPGQHYEPKTEPIEKEEKWYPEEEREYLEKKYASYNEGSFSDLVFEEKFEPYALSLLKEQEPRVMTLEEVKGMKRLTICAVEQRSKVIKNTFNAEYGGIVTLGDKDFLDFGLYADTNRYRRSEAGYGKSWRCWTSRPTDKQRQEVKWE